ncbi:hypothetical protein [Desulfofustis limnaeus]|uniref:Uncharacterized protein n=1 Tax=Desulfofustis limnaeus TaxID=2740163 RepID=A0ABM7WCM8_9BACT|nr:hypothetical protein [Desulfofustis limnaeus]BDD88642.1 hypothetical protein DPPLL_30070 [Desulfofustis limnaeus]
MRSRTIKEKIVVELGGIMVAQYHAHADDVELILIVRAQEKFFAVITRGRQAHRALARPTGTPVKAVGTVLEYRLPDECGYRVVYAIYCQSIRFGDNMEAAPSDPLEGFTEQQLPKHQIFQKCDSLNCKRV